MKYHYTERLELWAHAVGRRHTIDMDLWDTCALATAVTKLEAAGMRIVKGMEGNAGHMRISMATDDGEVYGVDACVAYFGITFNDAVFICSPGAYRMPSKAITPAMVADRILRVRDTVASRPPGRPVANILEGL